MPDYSMPPDERPADMAELARLTAVELRKRGIWAFTFSGLSVVNVPRVKPLRTGHAVEHDPYAKSMYSSDFDNLGPIGCADVIQAEEARKAQEWAGDT